MSVSVSISSHWAFLNALQGPMIISLAGALWLLERGQFFPEKPFFTIGASGAAG